MSSSASTPSLATPNPPTAPYPIHIGGHSRAAAERAGRVGDGFWPAKGDLPELYEIARQTAADHGRDPSAIELSGQHMGIFGEDPAAAVEELASWGASRMIVPSFLFFRDTADALAAWGDNIIANASS